jgi:hypothetical protein
MSDICVGSEYVTKWGLGVRLMMIDNRLSRPLVCLKADVEEVLLLTSEDLVSRANVRTPPSKFFEIHCTKKQMTWQQAMDYAASLGMRLATKFELQAISEVTDEFNDLDYTWSSSTPSNRTTIAWVVNLGSGSMYSYDKTNSTSVLCVREVANE